ncbi:hypothetical protein MMC11_000442 [Xylographa trunciseda]|nr:hypothetical protein [Xylographa trunciseda]
MAVASSSTLQLNGPPARHDHERFLGSVHLQDEDIIAINRPLLDAFLGIYKPSASKNQYGVTITWLTEACSLRKASPALQVALYALASNRVGFANGDAKLCERSRQYYGKALRLLNGLLGSPDSIFDDQALAAVRCLMIYELFESTAKSVHAWGSHQNGLVRLVQQRGSKGFANHFAKSLLMDTRGVSMIASIQRCIRSPLGNSEWCLSTPAENLLDVEHKIYDLAFELAATYELDDSACSSGQRDAARNTSTISQLHSIASSLDELLQVLLQFKPAVPLHDLTEWWDLESAVYFANILTLIMDTSSTIREIYNRNTEIGKDTPSILPVVENYDIEKEHKTAERIISALAYTTGDLMGLYGAQKSLFALRMTLQHLPRQGPLYEHASEMYDSLLSKQGLRHTLDLNKEWGVLTPGIGE